MGLGGAGGVKNFSLGICDGAPSTAPSSFFVPKMSAFTSAAYIQVHDSLMILLLHLLEMYKI